MLPADPKDEKIVALLAFLIMVIGIIKILIIHFGELKTARNRLIDHDQIEMDFETSSVLLK